MVGTRVGRNPQVAKNLGRLSKTQSAKKRGLHKRERKPTAKPAAAEPEATTKSVKVGGSKNGGERTVAAKKGPAFYPGEDIRQPKQTRKSAKPARLRASITPGTVLILLAGKHRGKRVVFLKQLQPSGLLLVTGPYKINGVPLRRVNAAYAIATSTKIDISSVKLDDKVNDAFFKVPAAKRSRGTEKEFFGEEGEKKAKRPASDEKKSQQKSVDTAVLAEVAKTPILSKYLGAQFSLSRGQYPHQMQF